MLNKELKKIERDSDILMEINERIIIKIKIVPNKIMFRHDPYACIENDLRQDAIKKMDSSVH